MATVLRILPLPLVFGFIWLLKTMFPGKDGEFAAPWVQFVGVIMVIGAIAAYIIMSKGGKKSGTDNSSR